MGDVVMNEASIHPALAEEIKKAVELYQCPGCVCGFNIECFKPAHSGIGCGKHVAGTMISNIGAIFLGLPNGFNRLGESTALIPEIFDSRPDFDKFNIPVWKYLDENGNTLVRGLRPRLNRGFVHIYLGDRRKEIDCQEITQDEISAMD